MRTVAERLRRNVTIKHALHLLEGGEDASVDEREVRVEALLGKEVFLVPNLVLHPETTHLQSEIAAVGASLDEGGADLETAKEDVPGRARHCSAGVGDSPREHPHTLNKVCDRLLEIRSMIRGGRAEHTYRSCAIFSLLGRRTSGGGGRSGHLNNRSGRGILSVDGLDRSTSAGDAVDERRDVRGGLLH